MLAFASGLFASCSPPKGTFASNPSGGSSSGAVSYSGYILVANSGTRQVVMYDSSFTESTARVLRLYATGNTPASLAVYDSESILVAVEGAPDRVDRINLTTGEITTGFILDSTNLTGTMKGIARLSGGDVLVSDATTGAHLERFAVSSSGAVRYTVGWPASPLNTIQMIYPLASNTFLACAAGTSDVVRIYNNVGTQLFTASATAPVPSLGAAHDVVACVADSSNSVIVAYNGATDTIRKYNSTLAATTWSYSDQALLPAPLAVGVRPNGNVLAVDTSNAVVEINGSTGAWVATYAPSLISTVTQILVMP
jgi:hypothetical protein